MKNYLLGVSFLIVAFYLIWQQGSNQIEYAEQRATEQPVKASERLVEENSSFSGSSTNPLSTSIEPTWIAISNVQESAKKS